MKNRNILPFLALAAVICMGIFLLPGTQPALLSNDELPMAAETGDEVLIPDESVPLTGLPGQTETESAAAEDEAALYEGLDETQIAYVKEVLSLVNKARADAGLPALSLDPALRKAAQVRAKECVGTFSHTRPNGSSYKTAITEAGVVSGYTGENVATGHTSAAQVVSRWLSSEGHRANILNKNFTKIGIGLQKNTGNRYQGYAWTQLFAA